MKNPKLLEPSCPQIRKETQKTDNDVDIYLLRENTISNILHDHFCSQSDEVEVGYAQ